MHTIIIADTKLIDALHNDHTFFDPFLSREDVDFCAWYPFESKICDAVPDLEKKANEYDDWRAIIVCDESSMDKRNPFDTVDSAEYRILDKPSGISDLEYIQQTHELKLKAFDCAAQQPLTKLATLFCQLPEEISDDLSEGQPLEETEEKPADEESVPVSGQVENDVLPDEEIPAVSQANLEGNLSTSETSSEHGDNNATQENTTNNQERATEDYSDTKIEMDRSIENLEMELYIVEAKKRQELRRNILDMDGISEDFNKPKQVICIARRNYKKMTDTLHSAWTPHIETQYSDFYKYNLYFEEMRYLIFDLTAEDTKNQHMGNFKFLYILMLIACNPLPENCMEKDRVYRTKCAYDKKSFKKLLAEYDQKLTATALHLKEEMASLIQVREEPLTDQDAELLLHSNLTVPVSDPSDFNKGSLYVDCNGLGLAGDCPVDELSKWDSEKDRTTNSLMRYLKQPRRAIKKAAKDMRDLTNFNADAASRLNEFQMSDMEEVMENQEIEMVSASIPNVFDSEDYRKRLEEAGEEVKKKEKTRMSRNCTIGVGACVLILFLIGLLPMWLGSLNDPLVIPGALIMMVIALVLVALSGFICLFFLRHALVQKWKAYNEIMHEIVSDIDSAMSQASMYISLVCRFLQEHTALMWAKYREVPEKSEYHLLQCHLADIYNKQEVIRNTFGKLVETSDPNEDTLIYDYDFLRIPPYDYPLPMETSHKEYMIFMESDIEIEVPYKLFKSVTLKREEIYD